MTIHSELYKLISLLESKGYSIERSNEVDNLIYVKQNEKNSLDIEYRVGSNEYIILGRQYSLEQVLIKLQI